MWSASRTFSPSNREPRSKRARLIAGPGQVRHVRLDKRCGVAGRGWGADAARVRLSFEGPGARPGVDQAKRLSCAHLLQIPARGGPRRARPERALGDAEEVAHAARSPWC